MKILLHDYSGHPFQVELSRELSRRGHDVTHSYCDAYTSGKGHLQAEPGETLTFDPVGVGVAITKTSFVRRLFQELSFGVQLVQQARRQQPEVVMASNVPIPTLVILAGYLGLRRIPWVLWHQDVQAVAIRSFAGKQLSRAFTLVAKGIEVGERWCSRRSAAVVVIADSFVEVHRKWGTDDRTTVIPNWAPLDEITPRPRDNDWSREHQLSGVRTLVYSGTLGLKHNPELLVGLARTLIDRGQPVRLVVVNQGPAEPVLREAATRLDVPLTLLPFQPYERLPEVLASGDVLVVLLEQDAGAFSVPSKTLSYLCAGRPIVGLMPAENLAATLVDDARGLVLPPCSESLDRAADWVSKVLVDDQLAAEIGTTSRLLAEKEFALSTCASSFEEILHRAVNGVTIPRAVPITEAMGEPLVDASTATDEALAS